MFISDLVGAALGSLCLLRKPREISPWAVSIIFLPLAATSIRRPAYYAVVLVPAVLACVAPKGWTRLVEASFISAVLSLFGPKFQLGGSQSVFHNFVPCFFLAFLFVLFLAGSDLQIAGAAVFQIIVNWTLQETASDWLTEGEAHCLSAIAAWSLGAALVSWRNGATLEIGISTPDIAVDALLASCRSIAFSNSFLLLGGFVTNGFKQSRILRVLLLVSSFTVWLLPIGNTKTLFLGAPRRIPAFAIVALASIKHWRVVSAWFSKLAVMALIWYLAWRCGNSSLSLPLPVTRKLFHVLAFILFVPNLARQEHPFLALGMAVALYIFFLLEWMRMTKVWPWLSSFQDRCFAPLLDTRERGGPVLRHTYLLFGVGGPVILELLSSEGRSAPFDVMAAIQGLAHVGVGDAVAAVVGTSFHGKPLLTTSKSLEGTASFFVASLFAQWLLGKVCHAQPLLMRSILISGVACAMELASAEVDDNLAVGVGSYVAHKFLSSS